jgi:uncharacterized protein (DUF2267 family)
MRAEARAQRTYNRLVNAVSSASELDRAGSERALLLALCMLCRRLIPQEAQHLIAQLPSKLQPQLDQCLDGPDRAVTADGIRDELARTLGLSAERADAVLHGVFKAVGNAVSQGQVDEVRGQLPDDMKRVFSISGP